MGPKQHEVSKHDMGNVLESITLFIQHPIVPYAQTQGYFRMVSNIVKTNIE